MGFGSQGIRYPVSAGRKGICPQNACGRPSALALDWQAWFFALDGGNRSSGAQRLLGAVADGKDPATIRDAAKVNPTLTTLADTFLREHAEAKRKPSTAKAYRDFFDRLILPELGQTRVAEITRTDVAQLHHSLKRTPYQANRVLAVLSKAFSWAEQHGYRAEGTNPCRNIEKFREQKRERFLSENELARLGEALATDEKGGTESPFVVGAIMPIASS